MKKKKNQEIELQSIQSPLLPKTLAGPPELERQEILDDEQYNQSESATLLQQKKQENYSEDDHSDEEAEKFKDIQHKKKLLRQNLRHNSRKKMIVGTGFSMDVTEFFQFSKKKEQQGEGSQNIFQEISGSRWAWIILLYTVTTGAIMPGWIMNIAANKILRISWRFFMQIFTVIPFVLYEYRTCDADTKKKYSLSYIFDPHNIIKPMVSALATSLWFTAILFGFQWTSVSHSIVMGSFSNFFLSIGRSCNKSSHDLEYGGQMFVVIGVILVLTDTFQFDADYLTPSDFTVNNQFYYKRKWWQRMFFDLTSFSMSFFMSQFSKYTSDLKTYYPPFLSMLIANTFICIFMCFSSFFFHGCNFQLDSFWGIWSLFSPLHFSGFMYMAIILSLGQLVSVFMITKMFPDPIIPALAMTLEPFIATLFLDLTNIQRIPGKFTFVGYLLMVPGLCLILVGQCLFQRISSKKEEEDKRAIQLLKEIKQIKEKLEERQKRKIQRMNKKRMDSKEILIKMGNSK